MDNITVYRNPIYNETPISVTIDGECNHAGETQVERVDDLHQSGNFQLMECCVNCGEIMAPKEREWYE